MEKLYYGGTIITMVNPLYVEAMVVKDDKIIETGKYEDLKNKYKLAEKINLEGKTLMPAFIDTHSHITMAASMLEATDLTECLSFDDIVAALKVDLKKKKLGSNDILMGFGYDHNVLREYAHPTKDILDKVSSDIPIFIMHVSGHMGCASSKTLELASIKEAKDIPGGAIGHYQDSIEPNGYLEEGAMMPLYGILANNINIDMESNLVEIQKMYAHYGITVVQDGASDKENLALLDKMDREGKLLVDVIAYPTMGNDNIEFVNNFKLCNKNFKIGGYKLILDGSPQGKSAWLTKPYENSNYKGYPWMEDEDVLANLKIALKDKKQVLVHCNGDAASDQYLKCYKKALEEYNDLSLRPVMIHCQTVRYDQLEEMAQIKMIPSIFIGHTYYWGDVHLKNLGFDRGSNISPASSAFKLGLKVNFHQDTPVTKPNMLHSIWCSVNRFTRSGKIIGEHECVSVLEALKAVTINAAYQYFLEDIKGSIEVNKKADFIILSDNPLYVDKTKIKDIAVLMTFKDGQIIYKK